MLCCIWNNKILLAVMLSCHTIYAITHFPFVLQWYILLFMDHAKPSGMLAQVTMKKLTKEKNSTVLCNLFCGVEVSKFWLFNYYLWKTFKAVLHLFKITSVSVVREKRSFCKQKLFSGTVFKQLCKSASHLQCVVINLIVEEDTVIIVKFGYDCQWLWLSWATVCMTSS